MMATPTYLSLDGKVVPYADARIHVLAPAVTYGATVFEGLRAYWNPAEEQLYVFRLRDHTERLLRSMRMIRFEHAYDPAAIERPILELLRANAFREDVHIRQMVYLAEEAPMTARGPVGMAIAAIPKPSSPLVQDGMHCSVSSWMRLPDNSMPFRIKCAANYHNSRLAALQAEVDGYDSTLLLNSRGKVAEGPGACFVMVRDGRVVTPGITSDILESITRQTLLQLVAESLRLPVIERDIDRSELYCAEEAFVCGSGWEITPIVSIDRLPLGGGTVGPITRGIQKGYFDLVRGLDQAHPEWRTPVYPNPRPPTPGPRPRA
jgi:branched-chain amino acid aminotransferase